MGQRWGLGPVFVYECVVAARRWQTYAGRAAFLAVLLVSLAVVWAAKVAPTHSPLTISQLAQVGESFFYAIAGTQLVLVLLAAPAYTAGAVCLDKARGTLTHVLDELLSTHAGWIDTRVADEVREGEAELARQAPLRELLSELLTAEAQLATLLAQRAR